MWIKDHYHNACSYVNDDSDINLEYMDGISYGNFRLYDDIIRIQEHKISCRQIRDFVVTSLEMRQYVVLFLDEYYRRDSLLYQKSHLLHEIMIYGYDDFCINYIAFDTKNRFSMLKMLWDELFQAYRAGMSVEPTITSIWIKQRRVLSFSIDRINNQRTSLFTLDQYRKGGTRTITDIDKNREYILFCGIDNTLLYINTINNMRQKYHNMIPYAGIHALFESKRFICQWLSEQKTQIEEKYEQEVLRRINLARLLYLKEALSGKSVDDRVILNLEKGYEQEKKILN